MIVKGPNLLYSSLSVPPPAPSAASSSRRWLLRGGVLLVEIMSEKVALIFQEFITILLDLNEL